jgi:hypothetical protein
MAANHPGDRGSQQGIGVGRELLAGHFGVAAVLRVDEDFDSRANREGLQARNEDGDHPSTGSVSETLTSSVLALGLPAITLVTVGARGTP